MTGDRSFSGPEVLPELRAAEHAIEGILQPEPAPRGVPKLSAPGIEVVRLSDVLRERIDWLWPGYLPLGKLAILDGDPGLGKSTIALDIAARVSRGWSMPPSDPSPAGPAGDVLILSAEDGLGDTIGPRLDAAGADSDRVYSIRVSGQSVSFPEHADLLEQLLSERDYRLVILDPFVAYLSPKLKVIGEQDVRQALSRLADIAERHRVAILLIRHLRKASSDKAIYRGGGAIGIIGQARVGLAVAQDPDNPDQGLLVVTKSNLAKVAPSLVYERIDWTGHLPDGTEYESYSIAWLGESEATADDLLGERSETGGHGRPTPDSTQARKRRAARAARAHIIDRDGVLDHQEVRAYVLDETGYTIPKDGPGLTSFLQVAGLRVTYVYDKNKPGRSGSRWYVPGEETGDINK